MTPFSAGEIDLVRTSFRHAAERSDALATAFYRRLFELDPTLRRLFHGDMRQMGQKFTATLGVMVNNLERFDEFLPTVRELGARHAGYRVRDDHYATVGLALIGTIALQLGESFTPAVRAAWTKVYSIIAEQMIKGARTAQLSSPAGASTSPQPHARSPVGFSAPTNTPLVTPPS